MFQLRIWIGWQGNASYPEKCANVEYSKLNGYVAQWTWTRPLTLKIHYPESNLPKTIFRISCVFIVFCLNQRNSPNWCTPILKCHKRIKNRWWKRMVNLLSLFAVTNAAASDNFLFSFSLSLTLALPCQCVTQKGTAHCENQPKDSNNFMSSSNNWNIYSLSNERWIVVYFHLLSWMIRTQKSIYIVRKKILTDT